MNTNNQEVQENNVYLFDNYKATIIGQLALIDELQGQNLRLLERIKFLKDEVNLLTIEKLHSPYAFQKEREC